MKRTAVLFSKKLICVIAIVAILIAAAITLVGCDESSEHTHEFGAWETINEPTCFAEGLESRVCSCGASEERSIPMTDAHQLVITDEQKATCAVDGYEIYSCELCKFESTVEIKATGNHEYESKVTKEPTCTAEGVKTFTCKTCDDSYTETIAATGKHAYESEITKEPTCTSDGVKTFNCKTCDDSYTETIAATGNHEYASEITKEPTCAVEGEKKFSCKTCEDSYTEAIAATGNHDYVKTDFKAPICLEDGYETFTCSTCQDSYINVLPSIGTHNYESTYTTYPDCTQQGVIKHICKTCGDMYTETEAAWGHSFIDATCTDPKVCSRCDTTEGEALGHNMQAGKCTRCDYELEVILYEDSTIKVTFHSAEKYKYNDTRADVYFYVENKTAYTITIQADAVSVNGLCFSDITMSDDVAAYSKGKIEATINNFDFDLVNINNVTSVGAQLKVISGGKHFSTYTATFGNIMLDGSGNGSILTGFRNDMLLYSGASFDVYFKEVTEYPYNSSTTSRAEAFFYVVNKTNYTLMYQASSISLNGYGYSSLTMSDYVLSGTVGIINLSINKFDFNTVDINNITSVTGQFKAYNKTLGTYLTFQLNSNTSSSGGGSGSGDSGSGSGSGDSGSGSGSGSGTTTNAFTSLKNVIIQRGTYNASNNTYKYETFTDYSSDGTTTYDYYMTYYADDDKIAFSFYSYSTSSQSIVSIYFDNALSGRYTWVYVDGKGYQMGGILTASGFTTDSSVSYISTNVTSSTLKYQIQKLAGIGVQMILLNNEVNSVAKTGVSVRSLGFTAY